MTRLGGPMVLADGTKLPLSAGIVSGEIVYLSGQLGLVEGRLVPGGIVEQTAAAIDNVERLLGESNLTLGDVCKTTVWLVHAADFPKFNIAYGARFSEPFPARSAVVSKLLIPGALVEIEVTATTRRDLPPPQHERPTASAA